MHRIIFTYGVISGTIVILSMMFGIFAGGSQSFWASEFFGYLIMLIALSMIFVGVKKIRDESMGGVIKFWSALGAGLAIAAIAGIMYVTIWQIYLTITDYAFINDYTADIIAQRTADGLSGPALDKLVAEMEKLKSDYGKFYIRLPMTFLEIFPVGALISIISAAVLRNPKAFPAHT